jgi:ribonuclease D
MNYEQTPFSYIKTNAQLKAFCDRLLEEPIITVDTEFVRQSTYFSKLATIQIATPKEAAIIDAIAPSINLSFLKEPFFNPNILKVFHAARQDLEIFYQLWEQIPAPIADTQVMGMVAGFGDSVGYEALVKQLTRYTLNKSCRDSNWMNRPLTDAQQRYAVDDVIYLLEVYDKLAPKIEHRLSWIEEEMALLENPKTYAANPDQAWKRLKIPTPVSASTFNRIKAIASWREKEAVRTDKPRLHILQDINVIEIAQSKSPDIKIRNLIERRRGKRSYENALLNCIKEAKDYKDSPEEINKLPPSLTANQGALLEVLKIYYKLATQENMVAQKLVCSSTELKELVRNQNPTLKVLQGWRYDVFGKIALEFLEGKKILKVVNGRLQSMDA